MKDTTKFTVSEKRLMIALLRDPDAITLSDAYCDLAGFYRALEKTGSRIGRRDVMQRIDSLESIAAKLKARKLKSQAGATAPPKEGK